MEQKKFGMISLGCDKNRVDGERLLGEIKKRGHLITDDIAEAQVLIVNTCAFLGSARKEAIDTVLEGNSYRSGALEKLVIAGCLPQKYIEELFPALTEGDVFLGTNDAPALFEALEKSYREGARINAVNACHGLSLGERLYSTAPHVKYLKISEGCAGHCTYCLIPSIRGKYVSYPMEHLLNEARAMGETEELVLVAQDTSRYGEDLGENKFVELIKKISKLDNICHIRVLYCYPDRITDALIEELKNNKKLIPYLDIPLQHSENRILKLMGRRGTREEYLAIFEKLRKEIPEIALRTTFITGFPSETEEEHEALKGFLREAKFENCGFFTYSREEGTPAYKMAGQIPAATKKRRQRELYAVQREVAREKTDSCVGKTLEVLCDGIDYERSCFRGRAYFQAPEIDGEVFFTAPQAAEGRRYLVKIDRADDYDLYGHIEETLL